ncbi:MAG: sigma factor-like helix-turn-helix DNA-binding protein [Ornithinimicrobium sp.]
MRLTYWDGFTLAQAARLPRMPEGTIRSRHHRARQQLRRILSPPTSHP